MIMISKRYIRIDIMINSEYSSKRWMRLSAWSAGFCPRGPCETYYDINI